MTRFLLALVAIISVFANLAPVSAQTDFFEGNIIGNEAFTTRMDAIKMNSYIFRSGALNDKLAQTRYFLSKTKRNTLANLADGTITKYTADDVAGSLEYLTHSMNTYFANMKAYERTSRKIYKTLATQNLGDASAVYNELKAITWNSLR